MLAPDGSDQPAVVARVGSHDVRHGGGPVGAAGPADSGSASGHHPRKHLRNLGQVHVRAADGRRQAAATEQRLQPEQVGEVLAAEGQVWSPPASSRALVYPTLVLDDDQVITPAGANRAAPLAAGDHTSTLTMAIRSVMG